MWSFVLNNDEGQFRRTLPIWMAIVSISLAVHAHAAEITKPDTSLDAFRAAADPANGPPIADAVVPLHHDYTELGPPGGYYPERAVRLGATGVAVIQCRLAQMGTLNDCAILAEAPQGYDFGLAMMKMAKDGYLKAQPPAGFIADSPARVIMEFPRPKR